MKPHIVILKFILFTLVLSACNATKRTLQQETNATSKPPCLILLPTTYHCVRFNPEWIADNKVESIIEREYLDGKNGRIHLVTILEYNSDGYLETKHSGLGYPKDDSPNKDDIFSKWEYKTEKFDSFVLHSSKIVRFHNEKGKMEKPDTLQMRRSIFNIKNASQFVNDNNEVVRTYQYDKSNRLISEKDSKGENRFTIKYHENEKIEILKFSRWHNKEYSSWITLDNQGRIIQNFDESNNSTHEFKYDDFGRMVEDKHWFKGKEPNYRTYEYIMKDPR